jgi:hypothetical protein
MTDQPQTTQCSGASNPESSPVSSSSIQLTRGAEGGGCTAPPPSRSQMTDYVVCGPDYFAGLREGVKQERERCARIISDWLEDPGRNLLFDRPEDALKVILCDVENRE